MYFFFLKREGSGAQCCMLTERVRPLAERALQKGLEYSRRATHKWLSQALKGGAGPAHRWRQVETAADWTSCSLPGLRRPFRGVRRVVVVPFLRRPASRYRCLATAGLFDGTQLHGTPARRGIPRRPSKQAFVAVPKLKKKHISSTTVSTTIVSRKSSQQKTTREFMTSHHAGIPSHSLDCS